MFRGILKNQNNVLFQPNVAS